MTGLRRFRTLSFVGGFVAVTVGCQVVDDAAEPIIVAPADASTTTGVTVVSPPTTPTTTTTTSTTTTSSPASSTTAATTSSTVPATRSMTAAFTGDILPHSPLWRAAANNAADSTDYYDFGPMFADIAPSLSSADLAVCHLETPIAPAFEPLSTFPLYGVPAEIADAIAGAGYDRCSTASNHVLDRRVAGVDRTVEVLTAAGISQSGMARFPEEIEPTTFLVNDIVVSHLSYTSGTNGIPIPADEPWRTALIDAERIIADAERSRSMGAEVVIISLHWGAEGLSEPTAAQRSVAEELTASGTIDLLVGHHAHVLQPIEQINGVWVAFGLGNILSNLPTRSFPPSSQDAAILEVTFEVASDGSVSLATPSVRPTWVDKTDGWVIRDVDALLSDPTIGDGLRGQLERSLERTQRVLGDFLIA